MFGLNFKLLHNIKVNAVIISYETYGQKINTRNPTAYWRLSENFGIIGKDETGNHSGNYSTDSSNITNNGLLVNDINKGINFSTPGTKLDGFSVTPNSTYSITGIIQLNSSDGTQDLLMSAADSGIMIQPNDSITWFNSIAGANYVLTLGEVYHFVFVISGSDVELFINGASVDTSTNGSIKSYTTIGEITTGEEFNGIIDEIAIFDYALLQDDITDLYNSSISGMLSYSLIIDHTLIDDDLYDFPILVNLASDSGLNSFDTVDLFNETNSGNKAHRYWRIFIYEADTSTQSTSIVNEIEFRESLAGPDVTLPIGNNNEITASSTYSSTYSADKAFSGVLSSYWQSDIFRTNQWIKYDTGPNDPINVIELSIHIGSSPELGGPIDFSLQYSDDDINWYDRIVVNNQSAWIADETRIYNVKSDEYINEKIDVSYIQQDIEPAVMEDNFVGYNGDEPNTKFWIQPSNIYSIQANKLQVIQTTSVYSLMDSIFEISGDFDVEVKSAIDPFNYTENWYCRFSIYQVSSPTNIVRIGRRRNNGEKIYSYITTPLVIDIEDTVDMSVNFRIVRVGSIISTYYDLGNSTWIRLSQGTWTTGNIKVQFFVDSSVANDPMVVNFDDFKVNSGNVIWPEGTYSADPSIQTQNCKVEISTWDQSNKQANLWVKVPYISKDVDTHLILSYSSLNDYNLDNIGSTGTLQSTVVWSEYDSVYHLSSIYNIYAQKIVDIYPDTIIGIEGDGYAYSSIGGLTSEIGGTNINEDYITISILVRTISDIISGAIQISSGDAFNTNYLSWDIAPFLSFMSDNIYYRISLKLSDAIGSGINLDSINFCGLYVYTGTLSDVAFKNVNYYKYSTDTVGMLDSKGITNGTYETLTNADIITIGNIKGLYFDGTSNFVDIQTNNVFNIGISDDIHMESYITNTFSQDSRLLQTRGTSARGYFQGVNSDTEISTMTAQNNDTDYLYDTSTVTSILGIPTHITTQFDNSLGLHSNYMNGSSIASTQTLVGNMTNIEVTPSKNTTIGCAWDSKISASLFFNGNVSEVRYSTKLKSPSWINANYNSIQDSLITYSIYYPY